MDLTILAVIPTLFNDWTKKMVDCLSCIEGKWGMIEICCITQNGEFFVSLL
jgi:hypothetical protein